MIWSYGHCLSCEEDWAVSTSSYSLPVVCLVCGDILVEYSQVDFLPAVFLLRSRISQNQVQDTSYTVRGSNTFTHGDAVESLAKIHLKNGDGENRCSVTMTSLCDSLLLQIAAYLDPLDAYNLAITTKKIHVPSTEISTRHYLSPPESRPFLAAQLNNVTNVASRLVQESLIRGLARALRQSCASFTLDMAKQLVKLQINEMKQRRKVLLSGLALVQTVTGKKLQGASLDFYCTSSSLPGFRTLMLNIGYVCSSAVPRVDDDSILHIETYAPKRGLRTLPVTTILDIFRPMYSQFIQDTLQQQDATFFNYRNLCLSNIQKIHRHRFPKDYPFTYCPKESDSRQNSIQLFVCAINPEEVVRRNDLDICKCWFDGESVHIPNAKDTFYSRSTCSEHIQFINEYVPNYVADLAFESPFETLSESSVSDEKIMDIIQSIADTMQSVSHQTQVAVLGPDQCYRSSSYCVALHLHNKWIRMLKRALHYIQLGFDIPISNDIKEMFLGVEIAQNKTRLL